MREDGVAPPVPDNPASYLTDWLFEIGPTVPSGMGMVPLTWRDLTAWQDITGVELDPWEAKLVRTLSGAYLAASQDAKEPSCPAPWLSPQWVEQNREAVNRRMARENEMRRKVAAMKEVGNSR